MNEPLKDQIDALTDLQQHPGWLIVGDEIRKEIEQDFADHLTRALSVQDNAVALDQMRQIAAIRKAGQRWLKIPQEKLAQLQQQAQAQQRQMLPGSRRPEGL